MKRKVLFVTAMLSVISLSAQEKPSENITTEQVENITETIEVATDSTNVRLGVTTQLGATDSPTQLGVNSALEVEEEDVEKGSMVGFSDGDIFIEGNLMYMNTKDKSAPGVEKINSTFGFNPKAGYFLDDALAVGVELGYNSNKNPSATLPNTTIKDSGYGGGVFARYYFLDLGKRFKTYGDLGLGFGANKNESSSTVGLTTTTISTKSSSFGLGLDLGMNYFVKDNIAISFGLADLFSFTRKKTKGAVGPETNFNLNLNNLNNFFNGAQFGLMIML